MQRGSHASARRSIWASTAGLAVCKLVICCERALPKMMTVQFWLPLSIGCTSWGPDGASFAERAVYYATVPCLGDGMCRKSLKESLARFSKGKALFQSGRLLAARVLNRSACLLQKHPWPRPIGAAGPPSHHLLEASKLQVRPMSPRARPP